MSNILQAIINIYNCNNYDVGNYYRINNRAVSRGDALEHFIKDSFANSYSLNEEEASIKHSKVFAYLGNTSNPPDIILKKGDAIEVKKIESSFANLALNSSYPKYKLHRSSSMLTNECKLCDGGKWNEKDIIYTVGVVDKNSSKLNKLCFVYGEDYAADSEIYENVKNRIKDGLNNISGVEFAETSEIGRVNKVDPLGITYLRLRGMWHVENPFQVFNYVYSFEAGKNFNFLAIINEDKYFSFPKEDRERIEKESSIRIEDKKIKNPNNPALLKKVKVITFER